MAMEARHAMYSEEQQSNLAIPTMAAADAVGKRSLFRRGLNATRIALAFVVTVVIVTVVVYAVGVVSRKGKLVLSVAGGMMYVKPLLNPQHVQLTFSLKANNPSGRVRFYYTDIHGYILLKNGTHNTVPLAKFKLGDNQNQNNMVVAPVSMLQTDAAVDVQYRDQISTYFYELRNNKSSSIISEATLTLNGTLTVGLYSVHNETSDHPTIYYCSPITIGAADSASEDDTDVDVSCHNKDPI